MNPTLDRRRLLGLLLVPVVAVGCGSSLPADGTHLDLTVPKEQAAKQAEAYKSYSKKGPIGPSPADRQRTARSRR